MWDERQVARVRMLRPAEPFHKITEQSKGSFTNFGRKERFEIFSASTCVVKESCPVRGAMQAKNESVKFDRELFPFFAMHLGSISSRCFPDQSSQSVGLPV